MVLYCVLNVNDLRIIQQYQMTEQTLDVPKIRSLIDAGFNALAANKKQQRAVLVIGDTGVGKSTILSYLAGNKLIVKHNGLNTVIDSIDSQNKLKIGHEKYSETTVPTKIVIEDLDFFDCSGFKDNRGDEFEISNSFFLQRLFSLYKQVKIFLIIDENYVSQARIDKLPKLIRNLADSFGDLDSLKEGVVILINRAKINLSLKDYCNELLKMAQLKGEKHFFNDSERNFIEYLVNNDRICIFKQADEKNAGKQLDEKENGNLLAHLKQASFIKSRKIKNIISESTKLSIRNYLDELIADGDDKFNVLLKNIKEESINSVKKNAVPSLADLKSARTLIQKILQEIKAGDQSILLDILSTNLPYLSLGAIEKDFVAVVFFREIYDKSANYFTVLKHKLISELTVYLTEVDKQINVLEVREQEIAKLKAEFEELANIRKALQQKVKDEQNQRNQTLASLQEVKAAFSKKEKAFEQDCQKISAEKELQSKEFESYKSKAQKELNELTQKFNELKVSYDKKSEELQLLSMENESMRSQIDHYENVSVAGSVGSLASKSSKYPDVVCPHFKNGGKCKHCIKKWKDSL